MASFAGLTPVFLCEDEASFGRISEPRYCWVFGVERPVVPAVRVREYRYMYGCVEPESGEFQYEIFEKCNTENFNVFLKEISTSHRDCLFLMLVDGAGWHRAKALEVPENIRLVPIPAYTPEMNPTEQCWREIRTGFQNKIFSKITEVVDKFKTTVAEIPKSVFRSITLRDWIPSRC